MLRHTLILATLTLPLPALAQQDTTEQDPSLLTKTGTLSQGSAADMLFRDIVADRTSDSPGYGSRGVSTLPEFSLVANDDGQQAQISVSFDLSNPFGGSGLSQTSLTLTGKTELAKNKRTSFGDFASGLTGGTAIAVTLIHYSGSFTPEQLNLTAVAKAEENCRNEHRGAGDLDTRCDAAKYVTGASMFIYDYNRAGLRAFLDSALPGGISFFGIRGEGSQKDFSYLDQAAFATKDVSRFSYSITALYGRLFASGRTSLTTSFTYGRSDTAQDEIMLCQPINANQTRCITAAGGAPERTKRTMLSAELRHAFGRKGSPTRFAIAPLISYDLQTDDYAAELPVYLIGDGEGKLRGGVRVAYENSRNALGNREDDVKFGVFVGAKFSLFQ